MTTQLTKRCGGCDDLIPDEQGLCDFCLLREYMDGALAHYDSEDQWSMEPLYRESDVVAALRAATGR